MWFFYNIRFLKYLKKDYNLKTFVIYTNKCVHDDTERLVKKLKVQKWYRS